MMTHKKAIIHKGAGEMAGQFTFYLQGWNSKVIAKASEHYTRKASAIKTILNYFPDYVIVDKT